MKQNATSVRLAVPNHGAVDSEKMAEKMVALTGQIDYTKTNEPAWGRN
jgi:hypothetical protein